MNKLVYSALALTLTGLPALATDNGWSGLDKEIESLSSSLAAADGSGPKVSGWIRSSFRFSSDDFYLVGGEDQSGFQFDTVRLEVSGDVSDNYGYKVSFDLGDGNDAGHGTSPNGALTLRDAYATWRIAEGIKGKMGRFKEPLAHSALTPEPYLIFIDRTAIGAALSVRDLGVAVSGNFDVLNWWFAFQDGIDGQADEYKWTVRVTADLVGTAGDKLVEGAYGAGDNTIVTVGVAYQDDGFLDDGTIIVGEAALNMGPFSVAAEVADFDDGTDPGTGGVFGRALYINDVAGTTPWDVTLTYAITPDWELAGRYEDTDDDDDTIAYAVGIDYYIHGHDIKWQAQWKHIDTDNAIDDSDQIGVGLTLVL
jgi:hypothetical protein